MHVKTGNNNKVVNNRTAYGPENDKQEKKVSFFGIIQKFMQFGGHLCLQGHWRTISFSGNWLHLYVSAS